MHPMDRMSGVKSPAERLEEQVRADERAKVAEEIAEDLAEWAKRQRAQAGAAWNPQSKRDLEAYAVAYDNAARVARRHVTALEVEA